jgi:hypothetical protein
MPGLRGAPALRRATGKTPSEMALRGATPLRLPQVPRGSTENDPSGHVWRQTTRPKRERAGSRATFPASFRLPSSIPLTGSARLTNRRAPRIMHLYCRLKHRGPGRGVEARVIEVGIICLEDWP